MFAGGRADFRREDKELKLKGKGPGRYHDIYVVIRGERVSRGD